MTLLLTALLALLPPADTSCTQTCRPDGMLISSAARCNVERVAIECLSHHADGREHPYKIGHIEFDDNGQVTDLDHLETVYAQLRLLRDNHQKKMAAQPGTYVEQPLVLVFVHGWGYDRSTCGAHLACFRHLLAGLVPDRTRPVFGIYVSWKGKQGWKPFNFFGRNFAAKRIGKTGLSEVLIEIDQLSKPTSDRVLRNVLVGHSLGGRMLFEAIRTARGPEGTGPWLGDVVILANPAVSHSRFLKLTDAGDASGRPELMVFGTSGDSAVGGLYLASRLAWAFVRYVPDLLFSDGERPYKFAQAVGHYERGLTHRLVAPDHYEPNWAQEPIEEGSCDCQWKGESHNDVPLFGAQKIDGRPNGEIRVVRTDRKFMSTHGDIYNPLLLKFIVAALREGLDPPRPEGSVWNHRSENHAPQ